MSRFQHYLITRINIDWNISRPKSAQERNAPAFLDYRLTLFEKTCLVAVRSQTTRNFKWLILLDAGTPEVYCNRIQTWLDPLAIDTHLVLIQGRETCLAEIQQAIRCQLPAACTHLITTNLDSDDIIAVDFVDSVQQQFAEQSFQFINFPFGYLYITSQEKLFLREWLTAPCHTLIESVEHFKTALHYPHDQVPKDKIQQIFTTPRWLMTAHEMNVRTRFDISAAWQPLSRLNAHFVVGLDLPIQSRGQQLRECASELVSTLFSRREWDTPKVKARKIANILIPGVIRWTRQRQYHHS